MSYYLEDPFGRIVDVHWKKKKGPGDPPDLTPPYCGRYGWGSIVADTGTLITGTPYGPNQFIPQVGTYSTIKPDPVYGALTPSGYSMLEFSETLTAGENGLAVQFIRLLAGEMIFTNNQLVLIRDLFGQTRAFGWTVPMASGQTPAGIPMVIKNYTITMRWHSAFVDERHQVGLGISHPLPGQNPGQPRPSEPAIILGSRADGAGQYTYDFQYERWVNGNSQVNEGNQFDPGLGGPAILWWMTKVSGGSPWTASEQFMGSVLIDLGDYYTWEIIGSCQPMPNYHPPS